MTKRVRKVRPRRSNRARPVPPAVKRERVFHIAQLMAKGEWERRKTDRQLAATWKMARASVQDMSAEASRLLDYTANDREQLLNFCRLRLQQIAEKDEGDRVPAIRTMLEHLGELRQRHLVTPVRDPFDGWTDDEIAHYNATGERPPRLLEQSRGGQG